VSIEAIGSSSPKTAHRTSIVIGPSSEGSTGSLGTRPAGPKPWWLAIELPSPQTHSPV